MIGRPPFDDSITMMKQAVIRTEGAPLDIVQVSVPEVPETGVLVKTLFAGVCHSDLGIFKAIENFGFDKKTGMGAVIRNQYLFVKVYHDDVIKWKHFTRYWPFVRGIHRSTVDFPPQRPVTRSFDVFFDLRLNKRNEQTIEAPVIWDAITVIMTEL